MSKRLRGSMSVYKETKEHKNFVSYEMMIFSVVIGYAFQSWAVWLFASIALAGCMGTKLGLIIGWVVTIVWALLVTIFLYAVSASLEFSLVFGFVAGVISWYAHSCGNLWWRDFTEAEWW